MSLRETLENQCPLAASAFDAGCDFNRGRPKNKQYDLRQLADCPYSRECNYPKTGRCARYENGLMTFQVSGQPAEPVDPVARFYSQLEEWSRINGIGQQK